MYVNVHVCARVCVYMHVCLFVCVSVAKGGKHDHGCLTEPHTVVCN